MLSNKNDLEKVEITLLLDGIYQYYGLDFRNYAYTSIRRRILYRMKVERIGTITELLNEVLHDATMMEKLFHDFSINVTEMFRNPSFFQSIQKILLPFLRKMPAVRIWHAGCSTGEEVYSMAILLDEEGLLDRTTIYATDFNERVLEVAKKGEFPIKKMQAYINNYMNYGGYRDFSEYYSVKNGLAKFDEKLSKNTVFAQHNLVTDGSFNEFHLIICRNVLIYFDRTLQERVHRLFYHSLTPNGFLCLGSREGLLTNMKGIQYEALDEKERIFQKEGRL